jgi:hypothetical protein
MKNNVVDIDRLADLLDELSLNDMDDRYWWEYPPDNPDSEDDLVSSERDEAWQRYHAALESTFEYLCEQHELALSPHMDRSYEYEVNPKTTWEAAADAVRHTINGVGYFHFNTLEEFMDSGPYTAREATLSHLHWLKRWPDVYGEESVSRMMERKTR